MKMFKLMIIVVCSALFAGCATAPMTSTALDSEAKQFTPEAGMASIYVFRDIDFGHALEAKTWLDGRFAGVVAPNTYQLLIVPPGDHTLSMSPYGSVFDVRKDNKDGRRVTVEAGKNYFFSVSIKMALVTSTVSLESVTEEEGRKEVLKLKRAEATSYYE